MFKKIKKAQVASTLTWVIGFLIIFFIMFLFTALTLAIAKTKGISKKDVLIENQAGNLILTKQLVSFLNTPIRIQEGSGGEGFETKTNIYQLILETENEEGIGILKNKENSKIFVREAEKALSSQRNLWRIAVFQINEEELKRLGKTREEEIKIFFSKTGFEPLNYFVAGKSDACADNTGIVYSEVVFNETLNVALCFNFGRE